MNTRAAHIELHLAVLLFGTSGLFGKLVSASPAVIVFGRTVFAAIAIFLGLRIFRAGLRVDSRNTLLLLLVSGLVLAVHWLTFFHAIQVATVAVGLVGFATFPVFVTFLEPLVSGQRIRPIDLASAALVFVGLLLVAPSFSLDDQGVIGLLWAVFSGALFAILTLINRRLVIRQSAIVVVFYQQVTAAICLLPFVITAGQMPGQATLVYLLVLGVLCTALPHTLFIKSLSVLKAQLASVVTALEPVYGIVLAVIVLNEIPSLSTVLGAVIVIGAVLLAMTAHRENLPPGTGESGPR